MPPCGAPDGVGEGVGFTIESLLSGLGGPPDLKGPVASPYKVALRSKTSGLPLTLTLRNAQTMSGVLPQ